MAETMRGAGRLTASLMTAIYGMHGSGMWSDKRPHRELVMSPQEREALVAMPDISAAAPSARRAGGLKRPSAIRPLWTNTEHAGRGGIAVASPHFQIAP
jgi:hypothetical protein